MTPKKKWAKATGIEAGDRVLCLDTEAVRVWRERHGFVTNDNSVTRDVGWVEEVEWKGLNDREIAAEPEALLVNWVSTGGNGRVTPFWMVIKDEA